MSVLFYLFVSILFWSALSSILSICNLYKRKRHRRKRQERIQFHMQLYSIFCLFFSCPPSLIIHIKYLILVKPAIFVDNERRRHRRKRQHCHGMPMLVLSISVSISHNLFLFCFLFSIFVTFFYSYMKHGANATGTNEKIGSFCYILLLSVNLSIIRLFHLTMPYPSCVHHAS